MVDAFEYSKNTEQSNTLSWVKEIPFVTYGYVREVISNITVIVRPIAQKNKDSLIEFPVTLLSLSSASLEVSSQPHVDDLVLLLSLDKMHPELFYPVESRSYDEEGAPLAEEENGVVVDRALLHEDVSDGYTYGAMVGILAGTVKTMSALSVASDDGGVRVTSSVDAVNTFTKNMKFMCCAAGEGNYTVQIVFDKQHAVKTKYESSLSVKVGFVDGTDVDMPSDAPVEIILSEKAPVTVTSGSTITAAFKGNIDISTEGTLTLAATKEVMLSSDKGSDLSLQSGNDMELSATGRITIGNNIRTLLGILDEYNSILSTAVMIPNPNAPPSYSFNPAVTARLAALKVIQQQVFK